VVSNAGFEAVAAADNLGAFSLARLSAGTVARLEHVLTNAGLGGVVAVGHPLDLSPVAEDATLAACARVLLEDEQVDAGVVGVVPLTPALHTLPASHDHAENLESPDAIASALQRLREDGHKPWVAVVDAGHAYDAFAARLEAFRIPTFRTVDRALRAFALWCTATCRPERPVDPYDRAPAVGSTGTAAPW
jgi:acyl-CoA synthetase (NDP forming)